MPQIPTSRDISYANPRSGRIANRGPSVNIGQGLSNLGQGLMQVGFDLEKVRENEQRDTTAKAGYDLELKLAQFRAQEEEGFNAAKEQSSESGIGFTRQFIEGYQKRADEFIKQNFAGISEAQNSQARQTIIGHANSLYQKANGYETQAKTNFYDRTTNSGLDTIRTQIRSNAAPFDELKRQGLAAIEAADMPEPWKAERRALWDSDASESKWRWKFEQDPQQALSDLRPSGTKNLIRKEEGFRSEPYWDVNAWRIGYGSDTVTTADGKHIPVKPGMKITQEDAERDLQYRLSEREGAQARKQVGDQWGSLGANVQAALESVAYNYGSLPNSVVQAVKSGDNEQIAQAIEALPANRKRRGREAAVVRGSEAIEIEDEYAGISYDRREQLASWGETQYNQQRTTERAASVDRYKLLIATEPERVDQGVILNDTSLDDGDKASLVTSLKTAMKESGSANAMLAALAQGSVTVNAFDEDQRKIADTAYDKLLGAARSEDEQKLVTSDFVSRTGYVPKKVQSDLRYGAASTDPQMMAIAMESTMVFSKNAPAGFNFAGSEDIRKKADLYRAYTREMGYSPEEAAKKLIDANDPEKASARDALLKSEVVKKKIKDIDAGAVSAVFDDSFMGFGRNPAIGANPAAEAAMVADYKTIFEESLVDAGGDMDAAKQAATARFRRVYGVSDFSTLGNTVIRYPVEKTYPSGPDGTHDWVRDQAVEALRGEGVKAEEIYLMPLPDGGTDKDVRSGQPARYQILYKDPESGNVEQFNLPFFADPATAQQQFMQKKAEIKAQSEQRMIEGRTNDLNREAAIDNALESAVGPDWMGARAAETAIEQQRMQQTIDEQRKDRGADEAPNLSGGW